MRGSSPRVRGLPTHRSPGHDSGGIIPARAGFTCDQLVARFTARDHPRACGVYGDQSCGRGRDPGSSPRVRGLLYESEGRRPEYRIIPARAGFTLEAPPGEPVV